MATVRYMYPVTPHWQAISNRTPGKSALMLQTHVFHLQTSKETCSRGEDPAFQMQAG